MNRIKTVIQPFILVNKFDIVVLQFFILFYKASMNGDTKILNILINHERFYSINKKDKKGLTALNWGE
jgi:hypothetical protein